MGSMTFRKPFRTGAVEHTAACLRKGGKLAYFNYDLAKEMGLIDRNHPPKMNQQLSQAVLNTFGIQIINEYDVLQSHPQFQKDQETEYVHGDPVSSIPAPGQNRTYLRRWAKYLERPDYLSGDDVGRIKLRNRGDVPEPGDGHSTEVF